MSEQEAPTTTTEKKKEEVVVEVTPSNLADTQTPNNNNNNNNDNNTNTTNNANVDTPMSPETPPSPPPSLASNASPSPNEQQTNNNNTENKNEDKTDNNAAAGNESPLTPPSPPPSLASPTNQMMQVQQEQSTNSNNSNSGETNNNNKLDQIADHSMTSDPLQLSPPNRLNSSINSNNNNLSVPPPPTQSGSSSSEVSATSPVLPAAPQNTPEAPMNVVEASEKLEIPSEQQQESQKKEEKEKETSEKSSTRHLNFSVSPPSSQASPSPATATTKKEESEKKKVTVLNDEKTTATAAEATSTSTAKKQQNILSIPYNLERKTCPAVLMPHCHPHHLEISHLYPDLVLDDEFWQSVLHEFKNVEFPHPNDVVNILTFTDEDVDRWRRENVCPVGFEMDEWNLLSDHFHFPGGTFDSAGFREILDEIGSPCTIAMATHLLMKLRCLESGRVRVETACFAMRAVQRVIARQTVAADLAAQAHAKRTHKHYSHPTTVTLGPNSVDVSTIANSSGATTPRNTTPRNTTPRNTTHQYQQNIPENSQQQEKLQFMVHPGVHRPIVTPVSSPPESAQQQNRSKSNNMVEHFSSSHHHHQQEHQEEQRSTSASNVPGIQGLGAAVAAHHGHNNNQQQQSENNNVAQQQQIQSNPNTGRISIAPSSSRTQQQQQPTPRSSRSVYHHVGAPQLGVARSPPKDNRVLLTEEVSGVMSHSPHRTTLKVFTLQQQRLHQKLAEEEAMLKFEHLEDARRKKYGMSPRRGSSPTKSNRSASGDDIMSSASSSLRGSSMNQQDQQQQSDSQTNNNISALSPPAYSSSGNNTYISSPNKSQQRQIRSSSAGSGSGAFVAGGSLSGPASRLRGSIPRSPSAERNVNNANSNIRGRSASLGEGRGNSVRSSSAGGRSGSAVDIPTSMPSGESHAVLMRARQQRQDGSDTFLSSKPRNAVMSSNPSVDYNAVTIATAGSEAADGTSSPRRQVLWNSQQETPIVMVSRTPRGGKDDKPTPKLGVHYSPHNPRNPHPSTSSSPHRSHSGADHHASHAAADMSVGGGHSSGNNNVVVMSDTANASGTMSPLQFSRRPRHWR